MPPAPLLAAIRSRLDAFPTTLEEDARELLQLELQSAEKSATVLPAHLAVLAYRVAIKKQLQLTQEALQSFLGQ